VLRSHYSNLIKKRLSRLASDSRHIKLPHKSVIYGMRRKAVIVVKAGEIYMMIKGLQFQFIEKREIA
jgi:hypothetical protein